jgi:hypothetical protein
VVAQRDAVAHHAAVVVPALLQTAVTSNM